jgi:hypothetical protein
MRVRVSEEALEVLLAPWEKILGLLKDIRVSRKDIAGVEVLADPMPEVMRAGLKVGLRVPWLLYVARTIRLDEAFLVRRGSPALSFTVHDGGALRRVIVSTPEAEALARELGA